jgi:hypothetical protein
MNQVRSPLSTMMRIGWLDSGDWLEWREEHWEGNSAVGGAKVIERWRWCGVQLHGKALTNFNRVLTQGRLSIGFSSSFCFFEADLFLSIMDCSNVMHWIWSMHSFFITAPHKAMSLLHVAQLHTDFPPKHCDLMKNNYELEYLIEVSSSKWSRRYIWESQNCDSLIDSHGKISVDTIPFRTKSQKRATIHHRTT